MLLQRIKKRAGLDPSDDGTGTALPWVARVRALLPAEQREHLVDVIAREQALVLLVDSAAWAARIRLSLPELAGLAAGRELTVKLAGGGRPGRAAPAASGAPGQ